MLPMEERKRRIEALSDDEAIELSFTWEWWARPNQLIPPGDWVTWLILAGRAYGKTRAGAETVRIWARDNPLVNLIGPTASDVRDIMVEGESGILAVCPPDERPIYVQSKRLLRWPNGSTSLLFSAEEPERLRGPQHFKLWADELAAWKRAEESWDNAMLGLRLGEHPQVIITTTPKPTKTVKTIIADSGTIVTRGTTYENRSNVSPVFYSKIITKYEGTRLGRQELNAEVLEDNPGALWKLSQIDADRVLKLPELNRIIVAVDPAVTSNEDSDETGIVVCGRDKQQPPHFYVFDDRSLVDSPDAWAKVVVKAYYDHKADRIIGEVNNGGDLVEAILRNVDRNVSYKAVHASRGKVVRAEPVAALYEQHRVHHVGNLPQLEDQMCDWNPAVDTDSPDRSDAMVWGISELSGGALGILGVVDHVKAEGVKIQEQIAKVTQSSMEKPVTSDATPGCPACGAKCIAQIGGKQKRCGECGHQWNPEGVTATVAKPMDRAAMLQKMESR